MQDKTKLEKLLDHLNESIVTFGEQLLILDAAVSELKSAVTILQVRAAMQMNPRNPLDALKALRALQKQAIESDPHAQENKEVREMLDLVQKWKKEQGGPVGRS